MIGPKKVGEQWHFFQKKVKKYTRSAIYHDIADYVIKNWLTLYDGLPTKGKSIFDLMLKASQHMEEAAR